MFKVYRNLSTDFTRSSSFLIALFAITESKITKKGMVGHVIHIDHYGNLITNIQHSDYLEIQKINGQVSFQIQIGREIFDRLHEGYDAVDPGECFVFFNSEKVLQIGINMGRASELLGIRMDASVYINFNI